MGYVVLVGAGPGDPGLLTIKGKAALEAADCIVYDRLASPELLEYARRDCQLIYVGKANHHHTMKQEEINELLVQKAKECEVVVRLKGGDPYVFGRGGEEALCLKERGIEVEVIPGVTSAVAALADAGIPITHRGLSRGFQVITAHSRRDEAADIDYTKLVDPNVTYVFLMGLAHLGEIATHLIRVGRNPETPCAVISCGTTGKQRKCVGQLDTIEDLVKKAELESPSIIVVGEVVRLTDRLDFFERRPLFGKKYLLPSIRSFPFSWAGEGQKCDRNEELRKQDQQNIQTGASGIEPRTELAVKLGQAGAEVYPLFIGVIRPIRVEKDILQKALQNDWLFFTSANGVRALCWNLREHRMDLRALGRTKIAVVGTKTAEAFAEMGITADLVPEVQTGRRLAEEFLAGYGMGRSRQKLTVFAAEEGGSDLIDLLSDRFEVDRIAVYENRRLEPTSPKSLALLEDHYDGMIFTSASGVKRSAELCSRKNVELKRLADHFYSIGPSCSKALIACGVQDFQEAVVSSYQGLFERIEQTEGKQERR